jgi:hypothetical protein
MMAAVLWELLPLALLSAVYPTLIAVLVVALTMRRPAREMAFFLMGGMLASVSIGCLIVFLMRGSSFTSGSSPPADPIVYFTVGGLSLLAAFVVRRRPPSKKEKKGDNRITTMLSRSERATVAFAAGFLIDLVPGAWYLVALKDIAESDWSSTQTVVVIVAFCIIQYALIEIPLICFVVAPKRAEEISLRFTNWLGANTRTVGVFVLVFVGCYMILRGILALL